MKPDSDERVFGPYIEITGWPRGVHNEEFHYQYSLPNTSAAVNPKNGRASCTEQVENAYKMFYEKARRVQNTREKQERNVKIDIKELLWRI